MAFNPKLWASIVPRKPTEPKPNHYLEMARVAWANRDQVPFAWRILSQGVCDGCALGTSGLKDWTIEGVHLCMVRLELMRLNTAPALDPARLADVAQPLDVERGRGVEPHQLEPHHAQVDAVERPVAQPSGA